MFDYQRITKILQNISDFLIRAIIWVLKKLESFIQYISVHRASRTTENDSEKRPKRKLPLPFSILFGMVMAVFSAFSVCVFHYMRTAEGVEAYYTDASLSLMEDILKTQTHILVYPDSMSCSAVRFFPSYGKKQGNCLLADFPSSGLQYDRFPFHGA